MTLGLDTHGICGREKPLALSGPVGALESAYWNSLDRLALGDVLEKYEREQDGAEHSDCNAGSSQRRELVGFLSEEVLMDAWETGQQLARGWGWRAVRAQVKSSKNAERYGYQWWRSQGALAYVGAEALYPERQNTRGQGSWRGDESTMGSGNGS